MAHRILFLDIDGVLNSHAYWHRRPVIFRDRMHDLDREAVARLNTVLDRTGAVVVVSSTWRIIHNRLELQDMLTQYGFTGRVLGCTTKKHMERGLQIQQWLDDQARRAEHSPRHTVQSFAIVDDDADMAHLMPHLVLTHLQGDDGGLQDHHVERLVAMLGSVAIDAETAGGYIGK